MSNKLEFSSRLGNFFPFVKVVTRSTNYANTVNFKSLILTLSFCYSKDINYDEKEP